MSAIPTTNCAVHLPQKLNYYLMQIIPPEDFWMKHRGQFLHGKKNKIHILSIYQCHTYPKKTILILSYHGGGSADCWIDFQCLFSLVCSPSLLLISRHPDGRKQIMCSKITKISCVCLAEKFILDHCFPLSKMICS